MSGDTTILTAAGPQEKPESTLFGVSIRAWALVMVVATICATHLIVTVGVLIYSIRKGDFALVGTFTTITEPLYGLSYVVVGYYFAKAQSALKGTKP